MTSWSQHIAKGNQHRQWFVSLRIDGVAPYLSAADVTSNDSDARTRLCIFAPTYAFAPTLAKVYKTILALDSLPKPLGEVMRRNGGLPEYLGGLSAGLVDVEDYVTGLWAADATPAAYIVGAHTDSVVTIDVDSTTGILAGTLLHTGTEALAIDDIINGTSMTVRRAYANTTGRPMVDGQALFARPKALEGRRAELHWGPLDGDAHTDERRIGEYVVTGVALRKGTTTYVVKGKSQAKHAAGLIPLTDESVRLDTPAAPDPNLMPYRSGDTAEVNAWAGHWQGSQGSGLHESQYYVRVGKGDGGELIGIDSGHRIVERGMVNTKREPITGGEVVRRVWLAGRDLRYWPGVNLGGSTPGTSMTDAAWVPALTLMDIALIVMMSPRYTDDATAPGGNALGVHGNWSSLPKGWGMGVPASRINSTSAMGVRARTAHVSLPNLVFDPDKPIRAGKWLEDNVLVPGGIVLGWKDNQFEFRLARLPLVTDAVNTLDITNVLSKRTAPGVSELLIETVEDRDTATGNVSMVIGPSERRVTIVNGQYSPQYGQSGDYDEETPGLDIAIPGGDDDNVTQYIALALAHAIRRSRAIPRQAIATTPDPAFDATPLAPGEVGLLNVTGHPDSAKGGRDYVNAIIEVLQRTPRIDLEKGVWTALEVLNFGSVARTKGITPAGNITSINTTTDVLTLATNHFTAADGNLIGLQVDDASTFTVGYEVQLQYPDGTVAGTPQTVLDNSGGVLTVDDATFGGVLSDGAQSTTVYVVTAKRSLATADQQAKYAYMDHTDRYGTP